MALNDHLITYTITDLKVVEYSGGSLGGSLTDLPGIRSMQITLNNDAVELRGDNKVLSVIDQGNSLEWQMEEGGMDLQTLAIVLGGVSTDTGVTPNIVRSLKIDGDTIRPYFGIVGVSPAEDGVGDLHIFIPKAKSTGSFEVTAQDQEFATPTISGSAVNHSSHGLMKLIQHETAIAAAIPA